MASLVDLKNSVDETAPAKAAPQNTPTRAGDDLMSGALGSLKLNSEDQQVAKIFNDSHKLLNAKMAADPKYAAQILPELQKMTGNPNGYWEKIVDLGDDIRINKLKEVNPDWFSSKEAAVRGMVNSATFGQISRIEGGLDALAGGNYEESVNASAEQLRLLHKAFPKADMLGEVASFLIPGSPAKMLFEKAGQVGVKLIGPATNLISKIVKNPKLLNTIIESGATAFSGTAAVKGVEGALGKDLEGFDIDRGVQNSLNTAPGAGLIGAVVPVGVKGLGLTSEALSPVAKGVTKYISDKTGKIVEQLSGTRAASLRAFNQDSERIIKASGTEQQIGTRLIEFLKFRKAENPDVVDFLRESDDLIPELKTANALLDELPNVDARPMIAYLKGFKPTSDPNLDSAVSKLNEWGTRIEKTLGNTSDASPATLRKEIKTIYQAAKDAYGKEAGFYLDSLKEAGALGREIINTTAKDKGGEMGQYYTGLMEKAAEKTKLLKYISGQLGKTEDARLQNSTRFIKRVFGANESLLKQRMAQLDQEFGTSFLDQASAARIARDLGPGGKPRLLPTQTTGRAGLAAAIGTAAATHLTGVPVVGPVIAGTALATSSPRIGAALIGSSDKVSGFVRRMTANPEALQRLAGILEKRGANEGKILSVRAPVEIRALANEIYRSFSKDGPLSASGTVRMIADTPYFLPLVHYFDKVEKQQQTKQGVGILYNNRRQ